MLKKALCILLASALVIGMSGCFDGQNETRAGESPEILQEGVARAKKVQEYVEEAKASEEYLIAGESSQEDGFLFELKAEGCNLVYEFVYLAPPLDNVADVVKETFAGVEQNFETSANGIRQRAPEVEKVVWRYLTADGEVIFETAK